MRVFGVMLQTNGDVFSAGNNKKKAPSYYATFPPPLHNARISFEVSAHEVLATIYVVAEQKSFCWEVQKKNRSFEHQGCQLYLLECKLPGRKGVEIKHTF